MNFLQYIRLHIKTRITQIAHYNTFHPLRYTHSRYAKFCLQMYRNNSIREKLAYFLRKIQTSRANNSRSLRIQNAKFIFT